MRVHVVILTRTIVPRFSLQPLAKDAYRQGYQPRTHRLWAKIGLPWMTDLPWPRISSVPSSVIIDKSLRKSAAIGLAGHHSSTIVEP
jgi:hypothetical protein